MATSILWYDLETWGVDQATSGIVSFACLRTDEMLQPVEESVKLLCKPTLDCIPDPEAALIHGISPLLAMREGMLEYDFSKRMFDEFNRPKTCVVGFNNIRFDDEFSRFLFYRNMYDPYSHQWKNLNSRWDVIDLFRVCFALRPDSLEWIRNDRGDVSFTLQDMAVANGIAVQHAHDALSDVQTTIALVELLRSREPAMFAHLYSMRSKKRVTEFLYKNRDVPFVHVSGMIPARQGHLALVMPVAYDAEWRQKLYVIDVHSDIESVLTLSVDELREVMFTPRDELSSDVVVPRIKVVHMNRCPVLLPAKMLTKEVATRLNIDVDKCHKNIQIFMENSQDFAWKIREIFSESPYLDAEQPRDVNRQLYDGLFSDADRNWQDNVHGVEKELWHTLHPSDKDTRLPELWLRLKARSIADQLDAGDVEQWNRYLSLLYKGQLDNTPGIVAQLERCREFFQNPDMRHTARQILQDVEAYLLERASGAGISTP